MPLTIFNLSKVDYLYIGRDTMVTFAEEPTIDTYHIKVAGEEKIKEHLAKPHNWHYIVGLGLNCKFIDLLFKHSFIKFIEISSHLDFIVSEIICKQTDTLNQELIHQRQF